MRPSATQPRDELGRVDHLVVPAERGVLGPDAVVAVGAVGDDLLHAVAVQRLDVLLREDLEEVLVAHAARGVAVAGLLGPEDRERNPGLVQDLDDRLRHPLRSVLVGAGASDPEEDFDVLALGLRHRHDRQVARPVRARSGGDAPRVPVRLHPAKRGLHLLRKVRPLEHEVAPHLYDFVDGRDDEDRARGRAEAARRARPDGLLGQPAADELAPGGRIAVAAARLRDEDLRRRLAERRPARRR